MRFVFVALAALVSAGAFAQTALPQAGLDRLVLVPGSSSGPVVGGDGTTLGRLKVRAALVTHYERAPLLLSMTDGAGAQGTREVIGHRIQAHLLLGLGLTEWLDVQLQVPLTIYQSGESLAGLGLARLESFGLGSPVLGARVRLLSREKDAPVDLSVQLGVALPLGSPGALTGGRFAALPSVHVSRSLDFLHFAASLGASLEPAVAVGAQRLGSQLELTAMAGIGQGVRGELLSRSVVSFAGATPQTELLVGVRALTFAPLDLFLHAGPTLGNAPGAPAFRVLAGIGGGNGGKAPAPVPVDPCTLATHTPEQCPLLDDDHDRVLNASDRCPLVAEDIDGVEDTDGCIDEDNDHDGIPDASDRCRDLAGVAAHQGCPVPDVDHDGVLDADDACPSEPGPVERKGCPVRDRDRDGLEDGIDACPDEAGIPELRGCAPKDRDGDEVFDHLDNCPEVKGAKDNQGCPAKQKQLVVITKERLVIKEKVFFATGKSTILPRSFGLLDQVAAVLKSHPEILHVVVEGHTDSTGSAELNRTLSQDRANSVMAYLVKKQVAADRLAARGYGPDRPAADNATAAGRELNRRVEFVIPSTEPEQKDQKEEVKP